MTVRYAVVAFSLLGCQLVAGVDGYEPTSALGGGGAIVESGGGGDVPPAGGSGGGLGGASAECADQRICVPRVAGWSDPALVTDGFAELSVCPGPPTASFEIYPAVDNPPPAQCTCPCTLPPPPLACQAHAEVYLTGNPCSQGMNPEYAGPVELACTDTGVGGGTEVHWTESARTDAFCSGGGTPNVMLPPLPSRAVCEDVVQGECTDGVCGIPGLAGAGARWCVRADGDRECPGPPYTRREVLFYTRTDGRGCDDCSCGSLTNAQCNGFVDGYGTDTCGDDATLIPKAMCTGYSANSSASEVGLIYTPSIAGGTCDVIGGAPHGTVTTAGVVTFCCVP